MTAAAQLEKPSAAESQIGRHLDDSNQYVSFWIDEQLIGVPVHAVQEVLNPQQVARTPKARDEADGHVRESSRLDEVANNLLEKLRAV